MASTRRALVCALAFVSSVAVAGPPERSGPTLDLSRFAGVDDTGGRDSTVGIQKAIALAMSRHQALQACGTFKISGPLVFETRDGKAGTGSGIIGCSEQGAIFSLTNPRQDGIVFIGASFGQQHACVLRNVSIVSPHGLKTAGSGVRLKNADRCVIEHDTFDGQHDGIVADSTALSRIADNSIIGGAAGGTAIALRGNDVNSYILRNYADNVPVGPPACGIALGDNVNGTYVEDNSMSHFDVGLCVAPSRGGKVQNIFFRQNAFDLSEQAAAVFDASGGMINRIFSLNDWFAATQAGPGILIKGRAGMGNWQFASPQVRDNATAGIEIAGALVGATFDNLVATANNDKGAAGAAHPGVLIGGEAAHLVFHGGIAGHTAEEFARQAYGFVIAPGADYIEIDHVDVSGNARGSILDQATASMHNRFEGNPGYNPVGGGPIAVGPSPFTYGAGATSESVYAFGGHCSLVTHGVGGTTVVAARSCTAPQTFELGPHESVTFTFSAPPTLSHVVH